MQRMTRLLLVSLALVLVMSLGMGVVSAQDDESVLVIGMEQEPPNLRPINNLAFAAYIEGFYNRNLWDWDTERNIYPIMVEEIPTLENGMVTTTDEGNTRVEITLREGLRWSDGEAITTADCELVHTLRSDPTTSANLQRANYPDVVVDFEVIDDLTFAITYSGAFPDYLAATEYPECDYPEHIFGPMIADGGTLEDSDYFSGAQATVGYGPYVLVEWNIGENMILERNEFWDGAEPAFDRIILQFITDDAQMRNAMNTGEIDISFNWSDDLQSEYASMDGVETFASTGVFTDALWIRSGPIGNDPARGGDALEDPLVRQAIAHAMDRLTYAEALVGPGIPVPTSWYPEQLWPEDLPFLEYNPDRARELLAEAGWEDTNGNGTVDKDGVELDNLRFGTTENTLRNNYQLVIQEALLEVGIGTDIQIIPATTFFASYGDRGTLTTFEYDLAIFAWSADPLTPNGSPVIFQCSGIPSDENPEGSNHMQFCDPRYDEVDNLIAQTLPGPERDALIEEAVRRHFEGYFWHGLRLRNTWYAVDSTLLDVSSVEANIGNLSGNYFYMVENWELAG